MSTGKALSDSAQVLPCALEELRCETSSFDPCAYIWDYSDNCVLSVLRTEYVNMVKQGTKYWIITGPDSTTKFIRKKKQPSKTLWKYDRYLLEYLRFTLCGNHQWRLQPEIWTEPWKGTEWCHPTFTVYSTH